MVNKINHLEKEWGGGSHGSYLLLYFEGPKISKYVFRAIYAYILKKTFENITTKNCPPITF